MRSCRLVLLLARFAGTCTSSWCLLVKWTFGSWLESMYAFDNIWRIGLNVEDVASFFAFFFAFARSTSAFSRWALSRVPWGPSWTLCWLKETVWVLYKIVVIEDCRLFPFPWLALVRSAAVFAQRPAVIIDSILLSFLRSAVIIMTTFVMLFLMALLSLSWWLFRSLRTAPMLSFAATFHGSTIP